MFIISFISVDLYSVSNVIVDLLNIHYFDSKTISGFSLKFIILVWYSFILVFLLSFSSTPSVQFIFVLCRPLPPSIAINESHLILIVLLDAIVFLHLAFPRLSSFSSL